MAIRKKMKIDKEDKENDKSSRLLDTAFKLFTEKGTRDTSIQEIVDNANVAKGTFYLYFKDKYEIRDILISRKSEKLFNDALKDLRSNYIVNFSDQVVFVINHVIDSLTKNTTLLKFISKNLSWGIYNQTVKRIYEENENKEDGFYNLFMKGAKENDIENPEVVLFMIIELSSSTCFNSILYNKPLPINEFKPYLYKTIRNILESNK